MDRNFTDVLELRIDTKQARESLAELSASVEKLYQAFASYNLNPELDRCTDYVTMEDELRVHSKPLVQLLPEELEKYGRKAMTTRGDADDFRYFLPRLLEFYPFIGMGLLNPQIVFSKLTYANWRQWSKAEQVALEQYFWALWKFTLNAIERFITIATNGLQLPVVGVWNIQLSIPTKGYITIRNFLFHRPRQLLVGAVSGSLFLSSVVSY